MHSCISDVADFRTACRLPIAREPDLAPSLERLRLLWDLLEEECTETQDALMIVAPDDDTARLRLAEVADGLADLIYVAVGAALELGIPLAAVWAEVHSANMRKTAGEKRADGKQMKPPGWVGPDVLGAVFGKGAP